MRNFTLNFYCAKTKGVIHRLFTTLCLTVALCLGAVMQMNAAIKTASVNGAWTSTATWGGGPIPVANDDIVINSGITVTGAPGSSISLGTLTLNGTWTGNSGSKATFTNATVNGTLTISASIFDVASTGVLTVSSGGNVNYNNGATFNLTGGLTINAGGTFTMLQNKITVAKATICNGLIDLIASTSANTFTGVVSGTGTIKTGAVAVTFTAASTSTFLQAGGGTLTFKNPGSNVTLPTTVNNLTIEGNSSTKTFSATEVFGDLNVSVLSAESVVLAGNITVDGNLNINTGKLDLKTLNVIAKGNLTNNGTVLSTTGQIQFAKSGIQQLSGTGFQALVINSGATVSLLTNVTSTSLTNNGTLTCNGKSFLANSIEQCITPPPTLTAAVGATVDTPFDVTFTDNAAWRSAITNITVGGTALTAGYTITAGKITFTPSASVPAGLLQTSGTKNIVVIATGYSNSTVSQTITSGAAAKLAITTQPSAPAANGAVLAAQPVVTIQDQYGNATTSTASVTAAVGAGTWTLGGTTTVAGAAGTAAYSGLTASSSAAVTGATITFTSTGLTSVTSNGFNIPIPAAPTLTAAVGANVDASFDITFTDNAVWRSAITSITVGGITLTAGYTITAGKITFTPSASVPANLLQSSGASKAIVVIAAGYGNGTVSQTIAAGAVNSLTITTQPTTPVTNGGALAAQPVAALKDQYGNTTNSTQAVTVTANAGTWNLGGTLTVNAVNGIATFSGLTAGTTDGSLLNGVYLVVSSAGTANLNSNTFNIPVDDLATDYFRSAATADWNIAGTWEISHNGTSGWRASTLVPGASATMTTIQDGHTVTVSANTTIGNTTINNGTTGGTLKTTTTAVVTVSSGKTLTVNGTFDNNGTITTTPGNLVSTSAAVLFNANSTYLLSGTSSFFPGGSTVTWDANSTINVTVGPASGNLVTTGGTVYGNITFNTDAPTGSIVLFPASSQRIAGNLTIIKTGTTGGLQLISSAGTNILPIDGNYLQSAGTVIMNPSNGATTYRSVIVGGNFTLDGGVFRVASGTANNYLSVKGNFTVNNTANIDDAAASTGGSAYIHFAGNGVQTFSRSASSTITTAGGQPLNFVVNSGSILDMGTSIISGAANVNVIVSGAYAATTLIGSTATANTNLINFATGTSAGILPGMAISGGSIPANTYITAVISSSQIQISKTPTAAVASGVSFTIGSASAATIKTANTGGLDASFANGGTKTLNTGTNYEFNGIAAQVTGALLTSANNLTINNPAGVSLSTATTVSGNLTLTSGNLTLGGNNLTLSAAVAGTPSTAKHIVTDGAGTVNAACTAGNGYTFPVGYSAGTYNPVTITNTSAGSLTYSVLTKATAPALAGSLSAMWDITGATANSTFDFPWGAENITNTPVVYQYDGSSAWDIKSGGTTASLTTTLTNATSNSAGKYWTVAPANSTTWNGSVWSYGTPASTVEAIITGVFDTSISTGLGFTAKKLTISSGGSLTIKGGTTVTIQNELINNAGASGVTVEDTGSLVQVNDAAPANSGTINYIRKTTDVTWSDYTYWSSPVAGQKLNISPAYTSGLYYSYNDTVQNWKAESATTVMAVCKGYIIHGPKNNNPPSQFTATFKGVPNNGPKSIAVSGPSGAAVLIGNPYPSALNADKFLTDNSSILKGTIYFWTHKTAIQLASNLAPGTAGSGAYAYTSDDYASYNVTGGVGVGTDSPNKPGFTPNGKIAAGQSFFANTLGSGTVIYNNSMRVTNNNSQFFKTKNHKSKAIEKNRVWLNLTNTQGLFKQALVGYVTGATNGFDNSFDGESLNGNQYVDFYSLNQNKNLVIQGRSLPFDENDEVPLGYKTTVSGNLSINISNADGILAAQDIMLEDKVTNTIVNLKNGSYTFNTTAGTFNNRFVLRYINSKTLSTADVTKEENKVLVIVKDKQIKINSSAGLIDKVVVFDLLGKQIYQKTNIENSECSTTEFASAHQALIVKTTLQNGSISTEKIIY